MKKLLKTAGRTLFIMILAFLFVLATAECYVWVANAPYLQSLQELETAEYAIVPGCQVVDDKPSPELRTRLEKAVELYENKKVKKIFCSGDNVGPYYDELSVMSQYLQNKGIPAENIILDPMGLRTMDTMWRAKNLYHIDNAIICTQYYHSFRSVMLARHMGIQAHCHPADYPVTVARLQVREYGARLLALAEITLGRDKAFVREIVPLDYYERSPEIQGLADLYD